MGFSGFWCSGSFSFEMSKFSNSLLFTLCIFAMDSCRAVSSASSFLASSFLVRLFASRASFSAWSRYASSSSARRFSSKANFRAYNSMAFSSSALLLVSLASPSAFYFLISFSLANSLAFNAPIAALSLSISI